MLEIKNINKSYRVGDFEQKVFKDVSIKFRKSEFVAILGHSGSGKTTLLNLIGGLDRYDSGDIVINGKSTKNFKDKEWDAYRNNSIGFIFQSYNLIGHISILDNVEMGMTLSGISKKTRRKKAIEALNRVGLGSHIHKKPNQLSGGQMQRVAIARALANDPDIILADEPTGALDSSTSKSIMDLIKEISKDKLVIMVTHNEDIANEYASRIIRLSDGEILEDSNPVKNIKDNSDYHLKKTAMSFITALNLSLRNIITKKGRTLLTAFASSIGIIGIALILSLSNGFDKQIEKFENDTLTNYPITISRGTMEGTEEVMNSFTNSGGTYPSDKFVYKQKIDLEKLTHINNIDEEYMKYLDNIDKSLIDGISYTKLSVMNINLLVKGKKTKMVNFGTSMNSIMTIPKTFNNEKNYLTTNYDLLYGAYPSRATDVLLVVSSDNEVSEKVLENLGFDINDEKFSFDDIIGKELVYVINDNLYSKIKYGDKTIYMMKNNYDELYDMEDNIKLKISGIVRLKEDVKTGMFSPGIIFKDELGELIYEKNKDSKIVEAQKGKDYFVLNGEKFSADSMISDAKEAIKYLGGSDIPFMINIYPKDFKSKNKICTYLDKFNENKNESDKIIYKDYAKIFVDLSQNIMDAITYVLIAFSAISLIVSSIMIGIITYISVLERTKEIGILRALGARKKDITRVFNAETFIIGVTSGLIGIIIAKLLLFPVNIILENMTGLTNVAILNPIHALILIIISVILTLIGGYIPAIMASRKDPVVSLRVD